MAVVRFRVSPPKVCGAAAEHTGCAVEPARHGHIACARVVLSIEDEPPTRTSQTVLRRDRVRQVTECHRRDGRVPPLRRLERLHEGGELGVHPEFAMEALDQLPAWCQSPGELPEDLVLLVGPRERRVGPGLTVVVAQVLVSGEEPQAIADNRAAKVRREVAIPDALVPALLPPGPGYGSRSAGW